MTNETRTTPYPLRMPSELRQQIERDAKANGRSLNAEILYRLEEYNWVEAESAERRQIADVLMREKVQLLEDLSDKSMELHHAKQEIIQLREALQDSSYPADKMIGLEYEKMKRELKQELLSEFVSTVRERVEEAIIIAQHKEPEA